MPGDWVLLGVVVDKLPPRCLGMGWGCAWRLVPPRSGCRQTPSKVLRDGIGVWPGYWVLLGVVY